jgi:hypothetical protein
MVTNILLVKQVNHGNKIGWIVIRICNWYKLEGVQRKCDTLRNYHVVYWHMSRKIRKYSTLAQFTLLYYLQSFIHPVGGCCTFLRNFGTPLVPRYKASLFWRRLPSWEKPYDLYSAATELQAILFDALVSQPCLRNFIETKRNFIPTLSSRCVIGLSIFFSVILFNFL